MHADATQSSHEQFMFEVGTSNNYILIKKNLPEHDCKDLHSDRFL